jgi:hypothetical protein
MDERERLELTDAAIELLLQKDGDRDHMNRSDITCEQSMALVELLRMWRYSCVIPPATLGEILAHATGRTKAGNNIC